GHVPGLCPNANGYYPGTKISISEYDLSLAGVGAQANAIIEADTLGIFARENVSLACHWAQPVDGDELDDAFLMYRDYDGHGSEFGDEWVDSTSADQAEISVYGARRSSDGVYTVMVINKSSQALQSTLQLKGGISGAVHAWRWDGGPIKQVATPSRAGNALTTTYPPLSMTLYVVG
ncbi:MAG: endoglucanase, partial [Acidimicrobiales bacterium]